MKKYEKKTTNDKSIFEGDIVSFSMDDSVERVGKIIFDDEWKLVDIDNSKAIKLTTAFTYYDLKIYKGV